MRRLMIAGFSVCLMAAAEMPPAPASIAAPGQVASDDDERVITIVAGIRPIQGRTICRRDLEIGSLVKGETKCGSWRDWQKWSANTRQKNIDLQRQADHVNFLLR